MYLARLLIRTLSVLDIPQHNTGILNIVNMDKMDGHDSEKARVEQIDSVPAYPVESPASEPDHGFGFSPEEQKRIVWRIDRRLVTTLGVLYCVSLMDRTNLGAANIAGMSKELVLIGERYVSNNAASGERSPRPHGEGIV